MVAFKTSVSIGSRHSKLSLLQQRHEALWPLFFCQQTPNSSSRQRRDTQKWRHRVSVEAMEKHTLAEANLPIPLGSTVHNGLISTTIANAAKRRHPSGFEVRLATYHIRICSSNYEVKIDFLKTCRRKLQLHREGSITIQSNAYIRPLP